MFADSNYWANGGGYSQCSVLVERNCLDTLVPMNCHSTRELDDSVACGVLAVHTRGFVLIDHSDFAPMPYQTTPPVYTA